jgi:hypothetical protein
VQNIKAMSGGALSDPPLISSIFVQDEAQNGNQRPPMKKEAPRFTNQKCTPKMQGAQRSPVKIEALRFMNQKHTPETQGAQRPPMKKEAPHCHESKTTSRLEGAS